MPRGLPQWVWEEHATGLGSTPSVLDGYPSRVWRVLAGLYRQRILGAIRTVFRESERVSCDSVRCHPSARIKFSGVLAACFRISRMCGDDLDGWEPAMKFRENLTGE